MAYLRNYLYLTLHWDLTTQALEHGQTGIKFDSQAPASQSLVDSCLAACNSFWGNAASGIPNGYNLKFIRLARIAPDGKYVPGSLAYDATNTLSAPGGGAVIPIMPAQAASVATLLTAAPRGQASKGRLYLPPPAIALNDDFRWPATFTAARATAVANLLKSLNVTLQGPAAVMSKGTTKTPNGLVQAVTGVRVGSRPDVQRRRAKSIAEVYGTLATV